jgi:hypothetical protein
MEVQKRLIPTQRHGPSSRQIAGRGRPVKRRRSWLNWGQAGTVVSPLVAVVALVFTAQTVQQTGRQIGNEEQGRITDRFDRAVDQLDRTKDPDIQLGGVYALAQVADASPASQPAVVAVLSAFVSAGVPGTNGASPPACATTQPVPPLPDFTVVNAMDVLADRAPSGDSGATLNLHNVCLKGLRLPTGAYLRCAVLSQSNLDYVLFQKADLDRAQLDDVSIRGADFTGARLRAADLGYANYNDHSDPRSPPVDPTDGPIFDHADLTGTDFFDAQLAYAKFRGAKLSGANLSHADLGHADLTGADLTGAYIDGPGQFAHAVNANLAGTRTGNTPDPTPLPCPVG